MLALLCLSPIYPVALATRALDMLQRAAAVSRVTPEGYLSLLLSVLTGRSSQVGPKHLDQCLQRTKSLVAAACQGLQFSGGTTLSAL